MKMIIKQLVQKILENPSGHKWTLQGLGMLRLYLSKEIRLHIWDSRYKVQNVSTIHDHPWEFDSLIVAGHLENVRFVEDEQGDPFAFSTLKCGAGNCERSPAQSIRLKKGPAETYIEGDSYTQKREEIHDSIPEDGTVTIITRRFTSADEDHARVFWPSGEWVSAEPREATLMEIFEITSLSLSKWFGRKRIS